MATTMDNTNKQKYDDLIERLKKNEKLNKEEIDFVKYYEDEQKVTALDRIVKGVNDEFVKTYKFEEMQGTELVVKIKAPNALQQARINAIREGYLNGMGGYLNQSLYLIYTTFATFEVCGIDIPKELKMENVYNLNLVLKIGEDFIAWLNRFQS